MMSEASSQAGSPEPFKAQPILLDDLPPTLELSAPVSSAGSPTRFQGTPVTSESVPLVSTSGAAAAPAGVFPPPVLPPPIQEERQNQQLPSLAAATQQLAGVAPNVSPGSARRRLPPTELKAHWFFLHSSGCWSPFSVVDSNALEDAHTELQQAPQDGEATEAGQPDDTAAAAATAASASPGAVVLTDGGRYEVDLKARSRKPVYWAAEPNQVRRGTWIIGVEDLVPLAEHHAAEVEKAFQTACERGIWKQRIDLDNGDVVALHTEALFVFYRQGALAGEKPAEPRVLKRGFSESVDFGEIVTQSIDHLIILLPGPVAEMPLLATLGYKAAGTRRGTIVDCADSMRYVAREMVRSNFEMSEQSQSSGRVEILPVVWESEASDTRRVSEMYDASKQLCLNTIRNMRAFLTRAVVDSVSYTRDEQGIVDLVTKRLNAIVNTFLERNPHFGGRISLAAHGLGGCIAFDILGNQGELRRQATESSLQPMEPAEEKPLQDARADGEDSDNEEGEDDPEAVPEPPTLATLLEQLGLSQYLEMFEKEDLDFASLQQCNDTELKELGVSLGHRKKLLSGLAEFDAVSKMAAWEKKQEKLEQRLERRQRRVEEAEKRLKEAQTAPAASAESAESSPEEPAAVRYQPLKFKVQNLFLLGSPLGFFAALRPQTRRFLTENSKLPTCAQVFNIMHPFDPLGYRLEPLVDPTIDVPPKKLPHHLGRDRIHLEFTGYLREAGKDLKKEVQHWAGTAWSAIKGRMGIVDSSSATDSEPVDPIDTVPLDESGVAVGKLNSLGRIDLTLQEAPFDLVNEHLMSLKSHTSYWSSEDTLLFMLTRIYAVE